MEAQKIKPYKAISEIYSYLMRFINYSDWAEYYFLLSKAYVNKKAKVLELAGGNCQLSTYLKSYYKNIIVTDLSDEMLKQSKVKNIDRVCCNMEALPFRSEFDLVISAFDSVNYLLTKKSINNLFSGVHNILSSGGIFSFDVSLESNSLKNLKYLNRSGYYNGINYFQKSEYDKEKRIHTNKFKIITSEGDTFVEVHRQRIFPVETYFELLIDNGFIIKECYEAFSFNDAGADSERVQFIAAKEKKDA